MKVNELLNESRKEGDVVTVHQHKSGKKMGRFGKFNVSKVTSTQTHVYNHDTKETMKFRNKDGRGIGEHSELLI